MVELKGDPSLLLRNSLVKKSLYASFLCFCTYSVLFLWKWSSLPSQIPLYYSRPRGTEQLGSIWEILLLPLISLGICIIHFLLSIKLYSSKPFIAQLLMISQMVIVTLLLITSIKIVFLIS